jgi:heme exporter protein C
MQNIFNFLANPSRFRVFSEKSYPYTLFMMIILICVGLWYSLFNSPPDYQQGETVRIMYVHVPAAWMAMMVYLSMTIMSLFALVWRHPLADILSKCSAPIGASFTVIALVTGSIWGKPTWGTWWVWDARLTSVFILFLIYMGHITLVRSFEDEYKGARAGAILTLIGAFNLPIIKFSVDWWNTLHQPASVIKLDGPTIHIDMMIPLILMALGFLFFYFSFLLINVQTELNNRKLKKLFIQNFSKNN